MGYVYNNIDPEYKHCLYVNIQSKWFLFLPGQSGGCLTNNDTAKLHRTQYTMGSVRRSFSGKGFVLTKC